MFISHYESLTNYLLNLVANILSYALFFNTWTDKIKALDASEEDKRLELIYAYCVIGRKLFLYEYIPDHLNEDLDPIEFFSMASSTKQKPKHLESVLNGADSEVASFLE